MLLKNISGDVLCAGRSYIVSRVIEEAVENNICLRKLSLRNVKIINIALIKLNLNNACFWGSEIYNVDFSFSDLSEADFRNVKFTNCNFTHCDFSRVNFLGSSFKDCDFSHTNLAHGQFSNQSILYQNIDEAACLDGATYWHFGEINYDLSCFLLGQKEFIHLPKTLCYQFVQSADSQNAKISSYNS